MATPESAPDRDEVRVSRDVSPHDEMFEGNEVAYFSVGRSALECIQESLHAAQVPTPRVTRILDLPCGHGRVLRHLRASFPEAEIVACDLLRDGVDYCARTFGAIPVYSHEDPASVPLADGAFDLIWVGSLLTHLDAGRWTGFLQLFRRALRPGGVLVFSTHGRAAYDLTVREAFNYGLPYWRTTAVRYSYERSGFGYAHYEDASAYGVSLSSPAWVFKQLAAIPELRVVHFAERAWGQHHDVFACVREPDWQVHHPPVSGWRRLRHRLRERVSTRAH